MIESGSQWSRNARTRDGKPYLIRPIRADDAEREAAFIVALSEQSRFNRLMYHLREPSPAFVADLVNVDYRSSMALVSVVAGPDGDRIIGVARYAPIDGSVLDDCEFAIAVADEWQSRGIGHALCRALFDYAGAQGIRHIQGNVLATNDDMLRLVRGLGMSTRRVDGDASLVCASIDLSSQQRSSY